MRYRGFFLSAACVFALSFPQRSQAGVYSLDDGTGESGLGGFNAHSLWLNSFTSTVGMERITTVRVNFGDFSNANQDGDAVTARLYTDPNNDGNPLDAVLVSSAIGVVSSSNTDTYIDFLLPGGGVVVPAGNTFFVGVSKSKQNATNFGPARDTTSSQSRSWDIRWNFANTPDYTDLSTSDVFQNYDAVFTPAGNATIRAVGEVIPEPGAASLLGLSLLALGLRRRR